MLYSFLKEINPEYSLEGLMLKLKLQSFGHLMWRADSLEKTLMPGKIEGRRRKGMTEDEMVGWHHWLNGHEFEQTLGDGEGQGSLACYSPWGHKESNVTEQLNNGQKFLRSQESRDSITGWFRLRVSCAVVVGCQSRLPSLEGLTEAGPSDSWGFIPTAVARRPQFLPHRPCHRTVQACSAPQLLC